MLSVRFGLTRNKTKFYLWSVYVVICAYSFGFQCRESHGHNVAEAARLTAKLASNNAVPRVFALQANSAYVA